jgi:DNA-binding MarR family transcriptional regulator
MEFEKMVEILRKHPLAVRALSIVASQGPQHLSALASQLGVGKVSAHRVAKLLTSMNLLDVTSGEDRRYRHFVVPPSRRSEMQRLIQAVESDVPQGKALRSVLSNVEAATEEALKKAGLGVSRSPRGPYDLICQFDRLTIGVELLSSFRPSSSDRRKLNEVLGRICFNAGRFPFVLVVIFGPVEKALFDELHGVERRLENARIFVKFMWVKGALQMGAKTIEAEVVGPVLELLRKWKDLR